MASPNLSSGTSWNWLMLSSIVGPQGVYDERNGCSGSAFYKLFGLSGSSGSQGRGLSRLFPLQRRPQYQPPPQGRGAPHNNRMQATAGASGDAGSSRQAFARRT